MREYDSRLLIEYARSHMPEYRPQVKIEQHTTADIRVGLEEDLRRLPPEGLELLEKLLQCELEPKADDDGEDEEVE